MEGKVFNYNCVLGIDIGKQGGIAIWIEGKRLVTIKMVLDSDVLRDLFDYYHENYKAIAFVEKLSVRPDDIINDGTRASLGKLYRVQKMLENFNQIKTILEVVGMPFVLVHPMKWQSGLGIRKSGEEKPERKRRYKDIAGTLYKEVKATLWNADALLIMHFGRYALENLPKWVKAQMPAKEVEKLLKTPKIKKT